jgi:hypothetical protein
MIAKPNMVISPTKGGYFTITDAFKQSRIVRSHDEELMRNESMFKLSYIIL